MMDIAGEKIYNLDLLDGSVGRGQTKDVFDFVTAIAADRPLKDAQEARVAAYHVNNIMAFVQFGLMNDVGLPHNMEAIVEGLYEIIQACRLTSLRVEQFLDSQEEVQS